MADSLSEILRDYMAEAKNCFDGRKLLAIFEKALQRSLQLDSKDEAAIQYFSGLVELRKSRLGEGDSAKADNFLAKAAELAAKSTGGDYRSIGSLAENMRVCRTPLRYAVPGKSLPADSKSEITSSLDTLLSCISMLTQTKCSNTNELASELLSGSLVMPNDILPEALTFALTAIGDFLSLSGQHHFAGSIFSYITMSHDPMYLAARLYQGRSLWRHFNDHPSAELAHQLKSSYLATLKCISNLYPAFSKAEVAAIESSSSNLDALRMISRPIAARVTTQVPFLLVVSQYQMACRAEAHISAASSIVARAGAADILRYSGDRHAVSFADELLL